MQKHFKKSLQSFAVFPIVAANLINPFAGIGAPTAAAISPETNRILAVEVASNPKSDFDLKAQKIDAYFEQYDLPLAGHGATLVKAAEENDLPWAAVASIAMIESTGCKFIIQGTNNCFGWGHGKIKFKTMDDSIMTVGEAIGANSETTKHYYEGKSFNERLVKYNGNANSQYVQKVHYVMKKIEAMSVDSTTNA